MYFGGLERESPMIEIRFHGRGGQGAVVACNILADAAFAEGREVMSFPYFGVERRGAPVTAYTKIDTRPIRIKSGVYEPDYVIVLDPSLVRAVDVTAGLKENGLVLVNSPKTPEDYATTGEIKISEGTRLATVDARTIAMNHRLGSKNAPIVNSAILGAFARASGEIKIETLIESVKKLAPRKKEENALATQEAYDAVVMLGGGD